jgi:hypothetical protein
MGGRDVSSDEFLDALAQAVIETVQSYRKRKSEDVPESEAAHDLRVRRSLDSQSINAQSD